MNKQTPESIKKKLEINPLYFTNNVMIETTNICNYSNLHSRCPVGLFKEKEVLPLDIIEKILKELGKYNFKGIIYPHNYSEPLIDPRMFKILEMVKKYIPLAEIRLYSNGFMVNEQMIRELDEYGLNRLNISVYDPIEGERIHKLIKKVRSELSIVLRGFRRWPLNEGMNDKIEWFKRIPINLNKGCKAPFRFIQISANGDVVMCCHDYNRLHIFGNVKNQSLEEIIKSDKMVEAYYDLIHGKRGKYELCSHCYKRR